jgi:hypothetical protein
LPPLDVSRCFRLSGEKSQQVNQHGALVKRLFLMLTKPILKLILKLGINCFLELFEAVYGDPGGRLLTVLDVLPGQGLVALG